ncbi:GNAT family N-acetyltransferase [Streptomyces sp. KR2]|uniref:GNAT family N-acetyltransferase n=1 Tax=Streptomyces sp. KR2 TaxID=1514824 RepID=UPI003F7F655A
MFDAPVHPSHALDLLEREGHHLFLAYATGEPVGFISGRETTHPDKGPETLLYELGVASAHRRQGIGRVLIETLAEVARERDCRGMWVGGGDGEQGGAGGLPVGGGGGRGAVCDVGVGVRVRARGHRVGCPTTQLRHRAPCRGSGALRPYAAPTAPVSWGPCAKPRGGRASSGCPWLVPEWHSWVNCSLRTCPYPWTTTSANGS